jgi:hypothetical protein
MKIDPLLILPHFISWIIGFLCLLLVLPVQRRSHSATSLFLAAAVGWGMSSFLALLGILTLGRWHSGYVLGLHVGLFLALIIWGHSKLTKHYHELCRHFQFCPRSCGLWVLLALAMLPIWELTQFFPQGGWDAWQVWNFKAKFLFLSGERWSELFDPQLWRSSPHYPLLLPLINVWGWTFAPQTPVGGPMLTGFLIMAATVGLVFAVLRENTHHDAAIMAPLLLLTLPFFGMLAISQYSDLLLGYYLLATMVCLLKVVNEGHHWGHALLAGFFMGCLGFTKPEGMVAVGCVLLTLVIQQSAFFLKPKQQTMQHPFMIKALLLGLLLASLPSIIFHFFLSPGNQTFINAWTLKPQPNHFQRLQFVLAFLLSEMEIVHLIMGKGLSGQWNGLWLALGVGVILNARRGFRFPLGMIPLSLGLYLMMVIFYYLTNIYFDLVWWLQVSFHRILFSLLPLLVLWIFLAVFGMQDDRIKNTTPPSSSLA